MIVMENSEDPDQLPSLKTTGLDLHYFLNRIYLILVGNSSELLGSTVVECSFGGGVFEPHRRQCVVSLSKTHLLV